MSTSQRMGASVVLEIFTNISCGNVGQSMTTSCDAVPGPSKKQQGVLRSDSVSFTVTVTSRRRSESPDIVLKKQMKKLKEKHFKNCIILKQRLFLIITYMHVVYIKK